MFKVYVAGPITPKSVRKNVVLEFLENLRRGIQLSKDVLDAGFAPFSPFLDFMYFLTSQSKQGAGDIVLPDISRIKEASMEFLKICDAVIVICPHDQSNGTYREVDMARKLRIPIFIDIVSLKRHFGGNDAKEK